MTDAQPKKSDLGVRVLSAVVMIMIVATAAWLGSPVWGWLVFVVGTICYAELLSLVSKAFKSLPIRVFAALAGLAYVGLAANLLSGLPFGIVHHGPNPNGGKYVGLAILASVVGMVVFTDIGAYFAGRTIGGPKIAPSVSPSKTWAGLVGGMIAAGSWGLVALYLPAAVVGASDDCARPLSTYNLAAFLSGAIMAVVAQSGDFLESWLKRKAGVKDSSRLIPGHGGVFDRIDGLLPVAIVYGIFGDWLILGDLLSA